MEEDHGALPAASAGEDGVVAAGGDWDVELSPPALLPSPPAVPDQREADSAPEREEASPPDVAVAVEEEEEEEGEEGRETPSSNDEEEVAAPLPHHLLSRRSNSSSKPDSVSVREDAIFLVASDPLLLQDMDYLLGFQDEYLLECVASVGLGISNLSVVLSKLTEMCRSAQLPTYESISPLIRGLRLGVSTKSRGPSRVFSHHGSGSGVEMTGLATFSKSFAQAWGVCAWVWLDAEAQPFTLCSFLTKELFGVSVTLLPAEDHAVLLVESRDEKKRDGVQFAASGIKTRTWHYLCLVHVRKTNTLTLWVDDKLALEKPLAFPGYGLGSIHRAVLVQDMHGLTGPLVVVNNPHNLPRVASGLGKRQVSPVLAEGERLAPEDVVFAEYLPESVQGRLCLDLQGSHLGKLLAETREWTALPDREILRALGGPLLLLPFLQVHESKLASTSPVLIAEYLLQSVLLLASFLEAHAGNLTEFYECQGVRLLQHALETTAALPEVRREMLREAGRDLLSAVSALTRACGVDTVGTVNEGGARMARSITWKPNSPEFELDQVFVYNVQFWVRFFADNYEDDVRLELLLNRVVGFGAQRLVDRQPMVVRKRLGVRFFLDHLRDMLLAAEEITPQALAVGVRVAHRYVDTVIAPLFALDAVTREEVRVVLDFAIGSGFGVGSDSLRERRKTSTWDEPTIGLSNCALRLLVRLYASSMHHSALNSFSMASILAVEVVAFCGIGESLRALALRVIGLYLASSTNHTTTGLAAVVANGGSKSANELKVGFSYISTALAFAVSRGGGGGELPPQRFAARGVDPSPKASAVATTTGAAGAKYSSFSGSSKPPAFSTNFGSPKPRSASQQLSDLGAPALPQHPLPISSVHVSHEIYNALLSMTITPTGLVTSKALKWQQVCSSALSEGEEHLGTDQFELPVVVLDDAMKIVNLDAIQVILDLLPHMSSNVQQRAFQDLYVLLKFDLSNRKSMGSVPQWQTSLGQFISSQTDQDIVQMGMKIWVLILQDCVFRNECDILLEAFWLRASIGKQVSDLALNSLFESLLVQTAAVPPPLAWDALVKVAELAGLYTHCFELFDLWVIPTSSPTTAAMLIYNSTKAIDAHAVDVVQATRAVRRIQKLLSTAQRGNVLVADSAVFAIARVHLAFSKLRRKFEFDQGEVAFLDACAMLLVACARYLSQAKSATLINGLIELANASSPNRDVFLRSKWATYDLEPGFASLAQVTLEELSFSLNRAERNQFDVRFAKEKDRLAQLARARQELENGVREQEERQVFCELARLSALQVLKANELRSVAERWTKLLKQIALGNTIWRDNGGDNVEHFRVSAREDHLRRRLYLETNLDFASHDDAAYANTLSHSNVVLASPVAATLSASKRPILPSSVAVFDKNEEILYVVESARLVTASYVVFGRIEVSAKHVLFYASTSTSTTTGEDGLKLTRARWRLNELLEIHSRRYLLRPIAIELFFLDRTTAFFAFASSPIRDEFSLNVLRQKPLRLEKAFTGSLAPPAMVLKRSKLTEQWRKREMSNFEYLMKLNMIAGRTYNDLTQYFVFPWVICDYDSEQLDFAAPKTFRDLTKPVGAMNPHREAEVRERFEMFATEDMGIPAFHHGSHYSSAGVVLHYLIRLEPFTTLAIELQSGRFDVPDRLFHSIRDCFKSCYSSVVDCRELIPEFYYCAEVFENRDSLELGTRQDGAKVDNVLLPVWAKGDPELFCRINREALESDYVSDNLHHWIDLIFGYKQRGTEAELACNVFSHLSYEGAVDLDAIEPSKRVAIEMQILEFGQCPSQLLVSPHPRRMSTSELGRSVVLDLLREASYFRAPSSRRRWQMLVWRKQFWTAPPPPPLPAITPDAVVASAFALAPSKSVRSLIGLFSRSSGSDAPRSTTPPPPPQPVVSQTVQPPALLSITCFPDRAVLVHADFTASVVHLVEDGNADLTLLDMRVHTQTVIPSYLSSSYVTTRPRDLGLVGTALGESLRGKSADFATTQGGNLLVSSAYLDGTLRCLRMDGTKLETNLVGHRSKVSCLAQDGRFLVSGDVSGALTLWKVGGSHDSREEMLEAFGEATAKFGSHEGPLLRIHRHLFGHSDAITAVAISSSLGLICTGSRDGTALMHNLEDDSIANIRRLPSRQAFQGESIDLIAISSGSGTIIAHSHRSYKLCSFSPNGRLLHSAFLQERLNFIEVAQFHEQDVCITGGDRTGELTIRRTQDLSITRTISFLKRYRGVRCCGVFPNGKYVLVGCADGSVIVLGEGLASDRNQGASSSSSDKQGVLISE